MPEQLNKLFVRNIIYCESNIKWIDFIKCFSQTWGYEMVEEGINFKYMKNATSLSSKG